MKKYYIFSLLAIQFLWFESAAQDIPIISRDSLEALLIRADEHISAYNYEQAIDDSYELINLAKAKDDNVYLAQAYNELGHIYLDTKDTARAKTNYFLGLQYALETKNDTILMRSYNNLGNIFSEIPETVQKGIDYYNKVVELAEKNQDTSELMIPLANIGWTYMDSGKFDKGYPYVHKALKLMDHQRIYHGEEFSTFYSQIYMLHGRYFASRKEYDSASVYFQKSLEIAEKDSLLLAATESYMEYAAMLKEKGDYQAAYNALEKYNDLNSRIFEAEKLKQMEIATAQFNVNEYRKNLEVIKREQRYQNQIIEKSQEKVIVMVLSSLVLMFILFFLNKINRDRKKLINELKYKNQQLKEAKDEAEKLSMLKTRFFSTVSHEIRTPLYGVIGLTSLLLEDKSLAKHKTDLRSLKFSADYLLALINDVLQMNKMESNQVKLENVSFSLNDLINSITNSFEFTRLQNKNEIKVHLDEQIPSFLIGDPVRLSQVLMNLVGNAVKFTERGLIEISAIQRKKENNQSYVFFEVKDNGTGIPESKKKIIFEEFSQLESANYNYQGTGLGLPIVKKLLKLFGSQIHLESKEGEGSAFSFVIAFKEDTSKKQELKTREESILEDAGQVKNILIVDDNRINQVVTKRILEKKKFQCDVAADGITAVQKVRDGEFDLVLMDLNMPGLSGFEASTEIRKFNKDIPLVALTAVEVEEVREEIYGSGMNDIIVKPYDVEQFYQIIYRNLLANKLSEKV
ncbi:MAG: hybrid sensor histidine kinase/response regulator [Gramella sp.]|nr:hybrid sensor histidine kinase/response regulator [Christiangramia sp.]